MDLHFAGLLIIAALFEVLLAVGTFTSVICELLHSEAADGVILLCRLEAGVSRVLREDGGGVAQQAHLEAQVLLEKRGFGVTEDQMAFRGPLVRL